VNTTIERRLVIGLGALLMIYLFFRAYYIPLVHDEAVTFFNYIHNGKFLPGQNGFDANNHFLNSALTFCFYKLFGSGELSLRIANLIFFPVFLIFWYKLSELLSDSWIRWVFLLSGLLAHNFIEFFAFSRGYGMSMALLTGGLWFFIKAFKEERMLFLLWGIICLLLALYTNLSLLNTVILLMCLLIIYLLWLGKRSPPAQGYWYFPTAYKEKQKNKRWVILILMLSAVGGILCALRLFAMREHGNLYYGSGAGFWLVTVRSLKKMMMDTEMRLPSAFIIGLAVFCGLGTIFLFFKNKEKMRTLFGPASVFAVLLFGNALAALVLNKLFKVNYAEDRVGIYFFPFFICSICFAADGLLKKLSWRIISVATLPLLFFPVHFVMHVNFTHSSLWNFENIPHRFYDKIAATIKKGEAPPTMGGYRMREVTWAYQNYRHGGSAGMINSTNFPEHESDIQIVVAPSLGNWKRYYERIDYDKASDLSLLRRKVIEPRYLLFDTAQIKSRSSTKVEYFNLLMKNVDSLDGKSLYIKSQLTLKSWGKPFSTWFVLTILDKQGNTLRYERIPFDWLKTDWDGGDSNFVNGMQLLNIPSGSHQLFCYLWNIDKAPFRLTNGSCEVYELLKK
jgi:hypothetical protein